MDLLPRGLRTPGGGILLIEDDEDEVARRDGDPRRKGEKYKREVVASLYQSVSTLSSCSAFLFGVLSLTFSCLLYGLAPEWLPFAYTAQSAFYLPSRIFSYRQKAYHYFLFGA